MKFIKRLLQFRCHFIIIETTYPNLNSAKELGKILLKNKLAACISFSEVESMYFWQEKLCNEREILVKIKTKQSSYQKIEEIIKNHHSYKIPQIIALPIKKGYRPYLNWLNQ